MDKFLLAENPQRSEQSGLWIIHMLDPITIICCTQGQEEVGEIFKHFAFANIDGVQEYWTLSIYFSNGNGDLETKAFKLLDRAWRWYRSYMEWEDANNGVVDSDDEN